MAMSSAFLARALAAALALALVSSFPPAVRAALLILDAALPTLLAALASFAVFTAAEAAFPAPNENKPPISSAKEAALNPNPTQSPLIPERTIPTTPPAKGTISTASHQLKPSSSAAGLRRFLRSVYLSLLGLRGFVRWL